MSNLSFVVHFLRALSAIFLFSCCNPMGLGMMGDEIPNLFDDGSNEKAAIGANSDNASDVGLTESKRGDSLSGGEIAITIKNNSDPYASTALHDAVETNKLEIVEKLLAKDGIDVNMRDTVGATALHIAADRGNLEMVKLLLSHAAIVNVQDNKGNTPLHCAMNFCDFTDNTIIRYGIVKLLFSHGSMAVNMSNKMGETALHMAVDTRNLEMIQLLLAHADVDVNVQDKRGHTVLHNIICSRAPYEIKLVILEELLSYDKIDLNIQDNEGNTPLHCALDMDDLRVVKKLLVKDGLELNVKNQRGDTALHMIACLSEGEFSNADLKGLLEKLLSKIENFKLVHFCEKDSYYNKTVADLLRDRGMEVEAAIIEALVAKYAFELKESNESNNAS